MASGREEEVSQTVSGMLVCTVLEFHEFHSNMPQDISSDQSSLLNVVKALGEYLTSEEDVFRTKGR